jgi:hypothetical protein
VRLDLSIDLVESVYRFRSGVAGYCTGFARERLEIFLRILDLHRFAAFSFGVFVCFEAI